MKNLLTFDEIRELAESVPAEKWMRVSSGGYESFTYRALPDYALALSMENSDHDQSNTSVRLMRAGEGILAKYKGTTEVKMLFYETKSRCNAYKEKLEATDTRKELEGFGTPSGLIDKLMGDGK